MRNQFTSTRLALTGKLVLGVVKLERSHTAGRNVNWYSHFGKPFGNSQNVKHGVTILFLDIYQR